MQWLMSGCLAQQERLDREYQVEIITTMHNVRYEVLKRNGEVVEVENPALMPALGEVVTDPPGS